MILILFAENVNLTDEHLFVFYSTLLELQKILESALSLTMENAGKATKENNSTGQGRATVPLMTKMR